MIYVTVLWQLRQIDVQEKESTVRMADQSHTKKYDELRPNN